MNDEQLQTTLIFLGLFFLIGLLADAIGRNTRLPRVTLLIGSGIIIGQSGFDILPIEAGYWYEFFAVSALTMVAFLLGGSLTSKTLRSHGWSIVTISATIVIMTLIVVGIGLMFLGVDPALALLFAGIASATAPASTHDAIRQAGVKGRFVDTLKGIVAIDDVWGLVAFSILIVLAGTVNGNGDFSTLHHAIWEIGGAIVVGAIIGVPAAQLTGRLQGGEPLQAEALGIVFLTAGVSIWLDVSFLIAGMTAGAIIVNTARHHKSAFHEIERIEWPFLILFFILAGASLKLTAIAEVGLIGLAFVVLRILSRIIGGWVGATFASSNRRERPWFGIALLPQAGVAIGMALVAAKQFPEYSETLLAVTIGSTVIFEIFGPVATIFAVKCVAAGNSDRDRMDD